MPESPLRGRAVLVGVNEYDDPDFRDLTGPERDVDNMANALEQRFGFERTDIHVLKSKQATKQGIIDALERLIAESDARTTAVFHFSGHGSQMVDQDGDEADGFDEAVVPSDRGRGERENRDLRDDEIFALMSRLHAKTKYVTVIFDSCHSGTGIRGSANRTARTVPIDVREKGKVTQRSVGVDGVGGSPDRNEEIPYAFVGAARSSEVALETVRSQGEVHGTLTWHLANALRNTGPGRTLRDVMDSVKAEVTAENSGQHPQLGVRAATTSCSVQRSCRRSPMST